LPPQADYYYYCYYYHHHHHHHLAASDNVGAPELWRGRHIRASFEIIQQ
jgi:hypothetical protein